MLKKIISVSVVILGFLLFLAIVVIGYKKVNTTLSEYAQYENIVLEKGELFKEHQSPVFFLNMEGVNQLFVFYRMNKNYHDLLKEVNTGDKIKVYYERIPIEKGQHIDIIQLEKSGNVLISKNEHSGKYLLLLGGGVVACLYMIYLGYRILRNKAQGNTSFSIF